jgi:glucose-1-phosphate cytidylyltransferase
MVTYGDGVSNVDVSKLLEYHRSHGKLATITTVRPVSRFGVVDIEQGRVRSFIEKPRMEPAASVGFFVFERGIFDYLDGDQCILERGPLEQLAREGELMAYPHDGFFYAMDTYREYQHLNELWTGGDAPWKVWE